MPRGFTLIEFLVVLALFAILISMSVPSYQQYISKAKVVELLSFAETFKLRVIESNHDEILESPTQTVNQAILSVAPEHYTVDIIANLEKLGIMPVDQEPFVIRLTGKVNSFSIDWSCSVSASYVSLAPHSCRNVI